MFALTDRSAIEASVRQAVQAARITDIHTHLFPPQFGDLLLWGLDELLTYHYLVAEFFRVAGRSPDHDTFWALPKARQADLIWDHLFVRRSPLSEACRGLITCLRALGLDPGERDLNRLRRAFAPTSPGAHVDRVLALSGVDCLVMTNDPLDERERQRWLSSVPRDPRFRAALRVDSIVTAFETAAPILESLGYRVRPTGSASACAEVRRFLDDWIARMQPAYLAASLPPEFTFPGPSETTRPLEEWVLPTATQHDLPVALMIGCRRQINPLLRLAGDSVGRADLTAVAHLCAAFPRNRFLCTVLAYENQHELAVLARKFSNLHVFGCWWFLNTPSLVEQITRLRLELLGPSFTPQHSDARVLEQLIYKWEHTRVILGRVLSDKYVDLAAAGRPPTAAEIERDVGELLGGAALRFMAGE